MFLFQIMKRNILNKMINHYTAFQKLTISKINSFTSELTFYQFTS
jgi:hypothetical protein